MKQYASNEKEIMDSKSPQNQRPV